MSKGIVYNAESFGYSEKAKAIWEEKGFVYQAGSWDEIKHKENFEDVSGLIVRLKEFVNASILSKFPNLKFVVSATTGHDHLDLNYFEQKGIHLYSLRPHKAFLDTIPSTAEHTWALLMALLRNIPSASSSVNSGTWNRDAFRGHQLKNQRIGIVGLGRTGYKVATYAKAFEMDTFYYDPYVNNTEFKKCSSLEELFTSCTIVSLHIHLNEETQGLIDYQVLSKAQAPLFLINTSRGKVWKEEDIVKALNTQIVKGVATDVLSEELGDFQSSPLWKVAKENKNIIITPHIGGATWEAMWACEEFICNQII